MTFFTRVLFAALFVILAVPASALACAVCGTSGMENNSAAYFAMTMVMSGLPLAMFGGVGYWVYRRSSETDESRPRE